VSGMYVRSIYKESRGVNIRLLIITILALLCLY
jgi:hypothetical protein